MVIFDLLLACSLYIRVDGPLESGHMCINLGYPLLLSQPNITAIVSLSCDKIMCFTLTEYE